MVYIHSGILRIYKWNEIISFAATLMGLELITKRSKSERERQIPYEWNIIVDTTKYRGIPGGAGSKEFACQFRRCMRCRFNPWIGKIPWRQKCQPTLVFLPGKSHEQRRLVGCSPWGHKESDGTEHLNT